MCTHSIGIGGIANTQPQQNDEREVAKLTKCILPRNHSTTFKAQGISKRAGYFFAGYGCFPNPDVPGLI